MERGTFSSERGRGNEKQRLVWVCADMFDAVLLVAQMRGVRAKSG